MDLNICYVSIPRGSNVRYLLYVKETFVVTQPLKSNFSLVEIRRVHSFYIILPKNCVCKLTYNILGLPDDLIFSVFRTCFFFPSCSFLPAPTQLSQDQLEAEERSRLQRSQSTALVSTRREPPPYGFRKSWVPRSLEVLHRRYVYKYMLDIHAVCF